MARYIDADALIADVTERCCKDCNKRKGMKNGKLRTIYEIGEVPCRACDIDYMKDELDNVPTVDAVPVVRCKDCKYAYMTDDGYCNWCDIMADLLGLDYDDIHLPGDWFCADGKKVTES